MFLKYLKYNHYVFETINGIEEKGRIISFDIHFDLENLPLNIYFFITYKGEISEIFTSLGFFLIYHQYFMDIIYRIILLLNI